MRRRAFIGLVGGVAAFPIVGRAQPADRPRKIGLLMGVAEGPFPKKAVAIFRARLRDLGWTDQENITIEERWTAADPAKATSFAKELVALQPDLLIGHTTLSLAALLKETRTIPVVFLTVPEARATAFVASLSRPGGNVTGFINFESDLAGKWLQVLKDIAPAVGRIVVFYRDPASSIFWPSLEVTARAHSVELVKIAVQSTSELENAIVAISHDRGGGLIVLPENFITDNARVIASLALRHKLPAIGPFRFFPAYGGLISYGVHPFDQFERVHAYVDRILKGERPGDLPVQLPTKFEMVINAKTAKALGLTVPPSMLALADEVIE